VNIQQIMSEDGKVAVQAEDQGVSAVELCC
jgi:hypothetical protein